MIKNYNQLIINEKGKRKVRARKKVNSAFWVSRLEIDTKYIVMNNIDDKPWTD